MASVVGVANLCSYEIDWSLHLTAVGDGWTHFAVENGAVHLVPPGPLGASVLASISDETTRHLYDELFTRVGAVRRAVTFGIRCDSPDRRRHLDLTITPRGTGFMMTTVVVRAEPNPGGHLLAADAVRDPQWMVRACSWCKRIDVDGEWCELESGVRRLGVFEASIAPSITHGICDACYERMAATIKKL